MSKAVVDIKSWIYISLSETVYIISSFSSMIIFPQQVCHEIKELFILQAYTSQFISLVLFGLMFCEDRISMQERRREIIQGLKKLPGRATHSTDAFRQQS